MSDVQAENDERSTWEITRNRLWVAALLLALTMAGAVAARKVAQPTGNTNAPGGSPVPAVLQTGKAGPVSFGVRLDRSSVLQGGDGLARLELLIRGDRPDAALAARLSTDLVVVLDRSGSMQGKPIEHALASVRELIAQLSPEDRFGLVTYASGAEQAIPLANATAQARHAWLDTLNRVRVGGGTNMSSGIDLAISTVEGLTRNGRVPRVVLLSDGRANEGDASFDGLVARARRSAVGECVFSTVGVGEGFDENLMTALADAGTGSFYYVKRSEELAEIFASEFASARETVASALSVHIDPRPGVEIVSAGGYPLERQAGNVQFRPGALFGGQERRIWLTVRVPTTGSEEIEIGDLRLSFVADGRREGIRLAQTPKLTLVQQREEYLASLDRETWGQAVVEEEFGELKAKVSADLQAGDRDQAAGRLQAFVEKQESLNSVVASPAVSRALSSAYEMKVEVDDAFVANEPARTNRLSKKLSAEGYDGRRPGAKRP